MTTREIDLVKFLRSKGFTIEELAKRVGTDKTSILTYLRIPEAPRARSKGFHGWGAIAYLVAMKGLSGDEMVEMPKRIEEEWLSIDLVRELVSLRRGKSICLDSSGPRHADCLVRTSLLPKGRKASSSP